MRNAPFHAFTVSVRGGDNVDTLFPGAACELRTPGGEAALGREGHLQIKTSDAPEVRGPLFPLFEDSPGRISLVRPGGWHMAPSHLPKKKNRLPIQERTSSLSRGGGVSGGITSLPKQMRSPPYLSPPHLRHPFSWRSSRWVGSRAQGSTSLRKRPSSRQMKYGAGEPLETICFQ